MCVVLSTLFKTCLVSLKIEHEAPDLDVPLPAAFAFDDSRVLDGATDQVAYSVKFESIEAPPIDQRRMFLKATS